MTKPTVIEILIASSLAHAETPAPTRLSAAALDRPPVFEANQGQADPRAKFIAYGNGYRACF